jgi:AcrR family transcriptional regulator
MIMSASEPGERRSRREERKEETRQELIAAAGHVFAREGFHGASLEQIARHAGYTTGAIYWHFKNKDNLFLAVYEHYTTTRVRELEGINQRAEARKPAPARAWADQWMERLADNPDFLILSVEFLVHAWRNPPLRDAFANRVAAGRLTLARILEERAAQDRFELPISSEDLATVFRELGSGLGLAKLIDPDGIRDTLFGDFTELFFNLVRVAHLEAPGSAANERVRRTAKSRQNNSPRS